MSNLDNKQQEIEGVLDENASLSDVIKEVNKLKEVVSYIFELLKTRNF